MILDPIFICLFISIGMLLFRISKKKASSKIPRAVSKNIVKGQVCYVYDGDTVSVLVDGKMIRVRLDSIDCPEDGQAWGDTAKAGLIKMIGGKSVFLELHCIDRYNRTVATIYLKDKKKFVNVNERMVMLGHAWVYRSFYGHLSEYRKVQLNRLENWAISKRVGLWRAENPIAPWDWRRQSETA